MINNPIPKLEEALAATGFIFAHYGWDSAPENTDCGVYYETGTTMLNADNRSNAEVLMKGVVIYRTRDNSDAPRETIEQALSGTGLSWKLTSIQFDQNDGGFIYYTWRWLNF